MNRHYYHVLRKIYPSVPAIQVWGVVKHSSGNIETAFLRVSRKEKKGGK